MAKTRTHSLPKSRPAKVVAQTMKNATTPEGQRFKKEMAELHARAYAVAEDSRTFAGMAGILTTPDDALVTAKTALMTASRGLFHNSPIWKKAMTMYQTNLVGASGFSMKSNIGGDKPNEPLNRRIELDFWRWVNSVSCDAAGMQDFTGLLSMWVGNWFIDGDVPIRMLEVDSTPENLAGLQLHSYPSEALVLNKQKSLGQTPYGMTKIVMGVEQDRYGKHVKYHIRMDNEDDVVDASEMILLYMRHASNATRGAPLGHAVMGHVFQLESLAKSTLQAAKLNQPGGFFERDPNVKAVGTLSEMRKDFSAPSEDEEDADPLEGLVVDKAPGESIMLPAGVRFVNMDAKFPAEGLGGFTLTVERTIASGLNLEHDDLFSNIGEGNFSSARTSTVAHRDWYKSMHRFLISRVVYPIYRKWLMRMYLLGHYELNAQQLHEALNDATFNGRTFGWVDPARDSKEKKDGIAMGLYSLEKIAAEMGEDVHANLIANAAIVKRAKELGVPVEGLYDPTKQAELRIQGEALEAQANAQAQSEEKEAERQAKGFDVMQRSLDGLRSNLDAVRNAPAPMPPAPAPINVTPQVTVEAPVLNVSIGQRKRVKSIPVRDERGLVVSIDTVIEEDTEDAPPAENAVEGAEVQASMQVGPDVAEPPLDASEVVDYESGIPQVQEPRPDAQDFDVEQAEREAELEEETEEVPA